MFSALARDQENFNQMDYAAITAAQYAAQNAVINSYSFNPRRFHTWEQALADCRQRRKAAILRASQMIREIEQKEDL